MLDNAETFNSIIPEISNQTNQRIFNNQLWRSILNTVSEKVQHEFQIDIETISPFGFEVLMDPKFLRGNLRRFYCYIGTTSLIDLKMQENVMHFFYHHLMLELELKYKDFFSSVVLAILRDQFIFLTGHGYQCTSTDKLIDIQLRIVNSNILQDYSNYIICSLDGLLREEPEVKGYKNDIRQRWRFYQLYIIQEQLYRFYTPEMSPIEKKLFHRIFCITGNMINIFFDESLIQVNVTNEEAVIFEHLIIPRLFLIKEEICGYGNNTITVQSEAYHLGGHLSLDIDRSIYLDTMKNIQETYIRYI